MSSHRFLPVLGHPSIFGFCCFFAMVLECVKTCVIHASELVASYEKARVIELLRECLDFEELSAIQFCPRGLIRVTFKDAADKEDFVRVGSLTLDGHVLSVTSSDKPHSFVYVHYFPVEGDDALIRDALGKYGEVVSVKHQSFSGIPGLLTGSRVLTMVLSDQFRPNFVLMTTLCASGIKVSLHFVRFVRSVVIRRRIASLTESVGGVVPPTTRRMRAPGRGVSLLSQWRLQSLWWCLTPLGLLCQLSLIVLAFWLRTKQLRMWMWMRLRGTRLIMLRM